MNNLTFDFFAQPKADSSVAIKPAAPPHEKQDAEDGSIALAKSEGVYRILHTADWHLGKMLGEHSREAEHQKFLTFLLDQIRTLSVDALVIAGDVFDSANPPQSAVAQYFDFLSALFRQGECAVVVVAGNHDSPAHVEAPKQVLKALRAHVIGVMAPIPSDAVIPLPSADSPRVIVAAVPFLRDRELRIGVSGQSASEIQRELSQGIARRYQEMADACREWAGRGIPVLATGHLTVTGALTSESEREIHIGGLGAVAGDCFPADFAYVALGHLHRPQAAGGREIVRYSGSPIPLSFSEARDDKEVRVVDFANGRLLRQTSLSIPLARPLAQFRSSRAGLETALKDFRPEIGELPAWVEVIIEDPTPGEDLHNLVQSLVKDRDFQVIQVGVKRTAPLAGLTISERAVEEGIDELLGDPTKVFGKCLAGETGFNDDQRSALLLTFAELCSLHADEQRDGRPTQFHGDGEGGVRA